MNDYLENHDYDVVVVGSGMGSLSTAALLARLEGRRVLVLERHFVLGGFTHMFKRPGGFEWDVGLHYVGEVHPGSLPRRLFDFITAGELDWTRLPDPFDRFVYPNLDFGQVGDPERFKQDLTERFPNEAEGIRAYFADVKRAAGWMRLEAMAAASSAAVARAWRLLALRHRRLALSTTAEVLRKHISDQRLRALLASQWGTYGLTPSRAAFAVHATLTQHYSKGAYYPVGGARRIAECVKKVVEDHGGACLVSRDVSEIVVENGHAIGVRALDRSGKETRYYAPVVVSGAGAYTTYSRLLPGEFGAPYAERLRPLAERAPTAVTVYLGLADSPAKLGLQGENYWIYSDYDHERSIDTAALMAGQARFAYLSFPSLKTPTAGSHTAEILTFVEPGAFSHWADSHWKNRPAEYDAAKLRIGKALLDLVEPHCAGLSELVTYMEVSTPLSVEHFTAHAGGAVYGLPWVPERAAQQWLGVRTPVRGLYLTGSDAFVYGILGAAFSGAATAGAIRGGSGMAGVVAAVRRAG